MATKTELITGRIEEEGKESFIRFPCLPKKILSKIKVRKIEKALPAGTKVFKEADGLTIHSGSGNIIAVALEIGESDDLIKGISLRVDIPDSAFYAEGGCYADF